MKKIKSIKILNSSFFEDDFNIDFNEKLNCIMGGRGTGKSTILLFIKSAFELDAEEDKTINSILKANLGNGKIVLTLEDEDNKQYEIEKTYGDEPQYYCLPSRRNISFDTLNDNFECDIYPSQKIEEIGKNSKDRLELIDKRIINDININKKEIEKIQINLDQNAVIIRGENARVSKLNEQLLYYKDAENELKNHIKDKPPEIKENEYTELEKADKNEKIRNAEKRYVNKVINKSNELKSSLNDICEEIQSFLLLNSDTKNYINQDVISKIISELETYSSKILIDNKDNIQKIDLFLDKIEDLNKILKDKHQFQQNEFIKLKQKYDKHKEYINKYNTLSKKVEEKNILIKDIQENEDKRIKIKRQRNKLIKELNIRKKEIFNLRKNIIDKLNNELDGAIKITLTFGGITDDYEILLKNGLRGSNLKYNAIIPYIIESLTPDKFAETIHKKDYETLKKVAQIDDARSEVIVDALYETEEIYDIENLYCEDLPEFYLKVDLKDIKDKKEKEYYKKSDELSTGQRCTTVLPIIFAVSDNPLLIDQPEDNLDNKYITETIHRIIREQKKSRQLIFITHNPNIPVLSDAELNLFLNYNEKESKIDSSGDLNAVKKSILKLLEGGKDAFKKRKELYGDDLNDEK